MCSTKHKIQDITHFLLTAAAMTMTLTIASWLFYLEDETSFTRAAILGIAFIVIWMNHLSMAWSLMLNSKCCGLLNVNCCIICIVSHSN